MEGNETIAARSSRLDPPRVLLVLALALASWLRFAGLDAGLPSQVHPDENSYVTKRLVPMLQSDPRLVDLTNPYGYSNILLVTARAGLVLRRLVTGDRRQASEVAGDVREAGGTPLFLLARWVSAVAGVVTVLLLYFAVRDLMRCRYAGSAAAWVLATCFLHVRDSHFGTNDVIAVLAQVAVLWVLATALTRRRWWTWLLAGVLTGAAVGIKYNASLVIAPIIVTIALAAGERGSRVRSARLAVSALVQVAAAAVVGWLILNPQIFGHVHEFQRSLRGLQVQSGNSFLGQDPRPSWQLFLTWLPLATGWLASLSLPLGVWVLARAHRRQLMLLIAIPVLTFASSLTVRHVMLRYLVPILPFVAAVVGAGLVRLATRSSRTMVRVGAVVLLSATVLESALASVRLARLFSAPDTRDLASAWMVDHFEPGQPLYLEGMTSRLRGDGTESELDDRAAGTAPITDLATFVEVGVRRYVISSWISERVRVYDDGFFVGRRFYTDLERHGRRVMTFDPFRPGVHHRFRLDEIYAPLDVHSRTARGPVIGVYEVEPGADLVPSYELVHVAGGVELHRVDGTRFREASGFEGSIGVQVGDGAVRLAGRVRGPSAPGVDNLLVFVRGRFRGAIEVGFLRRGIDDSRRTRRNFVSGSFPQRLLGARDVADLEIVAIDGNVMGRLPVTATAAPTRGGSGR